MAHHSVTHFQILACMNYDRAPPSEAVWGREDIVQWSQNFFCAYEVVGRVHGRVGSQAMHFRSLVGVVVLLEIWHVYFIKTQKCDNSFLLLLATLWPCTDSCPSEPTMDQITDRMDFPQCASEKQHNAAHTLSTRCILTLAKLECHVFWLSGYIMKLICRMWHLLFFICQMLNINNDQKMWITVPYKSCLECI